MANVCPKTEAALSTFPNFIWGKNTKAEESDLLGFLRLRAGFAPFVGVSALGKVVC